MYALPPSGRTTTSNEVPGLRKGAEADRRRRRASAAVRCNPADVEELIAGQGGRCPICGRCVDDRSALDHEHRTKELRGVLCPHPCNSAIGKTDEALFRFAEGVARYAAKRRRVLVRRECVKACERCHQQARSAA